jgi:hypothetical protein
MARKYVPASVFLMMRGGVIISVAFFSVFVLKKKL